VLSSVCNVCKRVWIPACLLVSVISHWYRKSLSDLYTFPEISMVQASLVTKDFITSVSWPEIFWCWTVSFMRFVHPKESSDYRRLICSRSVEDICADLEVKNEITWCERGVSSASPCMVSTITKDLVTSWVELPRGWSLNLLPGFPIAVIHNYSETLSLVTMMSITDQSASSLR